MSDDIVDRPALSLAEAMDRFLRAAGLQEVARVNLCPLIWGEVVGPWYARFTHVTRVHEGVVFVCCDSAPRAHQLQLDAPQIIERLNQRLGGQYIRELRPSTTGGQPQSQPPTQQQRPEPPDDTELAGYQLDQSELDHINAVVAELEDEQLRQNLSRMLLRHARLRLWAREQGYTQCAQCGAFYPGSRPYCYDCRPAPAPPTVGDEQPPSPYQQ